MTKENTYDEMEAAGRGLRMSDLEGQTFMITALEEAESRYKDVQGNPKKQFKATIDWNGEEETLWLTGATVPQCEALVELDALPIEVMMTGEGKQGSPYRLARPEPDEEPLAKPAKRGKIERQPPHTDAVADFHRLFKQWKDRGEKDAAIRKIGEVTAKLAPGFLTLTPSGSVIVNFKEIGAGALALVIHALEGGEGEILLDEP